MSAPERPSVSFPSSVLFREVDGEMVLLNLKSEQYFGLDSVGADMVTRLTQMPRRQAVATLQHDYEVEPGVLESDLDALVTSLVEVGLLEPVQQN